MAGDVIPGMERTTELLGVKDRLESWLNEWFMTQLAAQREVHLGPLGSFTINYRDGDESPVLAKDGRNFIIAIETIMVYEEQPSGEWE